MLACVLGRRGLALSSAGFGSFEVLSTKQPTSSMSRVARLHRCIPTDHADGPPLKHACSRAEI